LGIRDGWRNIVGDELGDAAVNAECGLAAGRSGSGWPRLIGVVSWRSNGMPVGRSSGTISSTATTTACTPKEVSVVKLRRERSSQDDASVRSNMLSSLRKIVGDKDTANSWPGSLREKKKGRV
jgi:hypothetical protein